MKERVHYWARVFTSQGHDVKLIQPAYVRPYVKSNKNDYADAEALIEAASRPNMRFVQPKTIEQQDVFLMHRQQERLVRQRTALANQTRGLLAEYGIVQVVQIVAYIFAAVLIVSKLFDRSPLILLSGVGAMTAVLLLISSRRLQGMMYCVI